MLFLTQSHQVFFGHPLCLIPSTSHVIQRLTQSLSSFRSTCPNHLNVLFLIIKLTGSNPKSSLSSSLFFLSFRPASVQPRSCIRVQEGTGQNYLARTHGNGYVTDGDKPRMMMMMICRGPHYRGAHDAHPYPLVRWGIPYPLDAFGVSVSTPPAGACWFALQLIFRSRVTRACILDIFLHHFPSLLCKP